MINKITKIVKTDQEALNLKTGMKKLRKKVYSIECSENYQRMNKGKGRK